MKFRTVILVAVMGLVAAIVAVSIVVATTILERTARAELTADIDRSAEVFRDLQAYRESLFRAEARMTAQEPRVKAVIAAEDVSRETVLDVAQELRTTLDSDLLLFTDGAGVLIADTADPEATGFDMSSQEVIATALESGAASGVWSHEGGVTQVHARSMSFGPTTVGVLVVGHHLDSRVVETVQRQTGSGAAILLDGNLIATSAGPGLEGEGATDLGPALAELPRDAQTEVMLGGRHYLALAAALPGYAGDKRLDYVVFRSLDDALAASRELANRLYMLAAAALVLGAFLALGMARRIARPLDRLVGFTREIGEGKLETRTDLAGPVEVEVLGQAMNRMVGEIAESRAQIAAKERLEREMEIAERIQTSILPTNLEVPGLEIAARMVPADEVGGDYYDIQPAGDGCWIGVGDVAGHGLPAGLVMLMVQSATAVITHANPDEKPSVLVNKLNRALFENVRQRLDQDEHVTFTLLRYHRDGRVEFSGAHEEIVIVRANGDTEIVETPGTWLAARADIGQALDDRTLQLRDGDIMVLYTDGIIEAMNDEGHQYDLGRVQKVVADARAQPVAAILDGIFEAVDRWSPHYEDDRTAMVIRYRAP